MANRWACILATGFGCGYAPVASGTAGSLAGLILYLLLGRYSFWANLLFIVFLFGVGVYVSGLAERSFQRIDPGEIVIDEILGMVLVLSLLPAATYGYWLAAFVLFRVLDIVKPYPANVIERSLKGGWGIMLDDVVAAGYAILILHAFYWWVHTT